MPVSPSRLTTASGMSTSKLPPKATCTSLHAMPASASAARTAWAPISSAGTPGKRPKGCKPTPTIATSSVTARSPLVDGTERERDQLVAGVVDAERDDHELHLHSDPQARGVVLGQPGLDAELAR